MHLWSAAGRLGSSADLGWAAQVSWGWLATDQQKNFPGGSGSKASAYDVGDMGSIPGSGRSPGEGNGNPLQYSCPEKSHGQRSLVGYSPWDGKELDMTEQLHSLTHRTSWLGVSHLSAGQSGHVLISVTEEKEQEGKNISAIAGFAFTIAFLTKASHMTEPRVRLGGHSQGLSQRKGVELGPLAESAWHGQL